MTQGRKLKTKLKSLSISNKSTDRYGNEHTTTSGSASVTDRLAKLRAEQVRAEKNRQRLRSKSGHDDDRFACPPSLPTPYELNAKQSSIAHSSAAGPPPPLSWTFKTRNVSLSKRIRSESKDIPSLRSMCVHQISYEIENQYGIHADYSAKQFALLPVRIKERVLQCTRVTNRILKLFEEAPYTDLCLENASVSMSRLIQAFWKAELVKKQDTAGELKDDWEEDYDNHDEGEPDVYVFDLEIQEEDECSYHMQRILQVLIGNLDLSKRYTLFTPLSLTLTSLNISFIRPFLPSTAIAYLISTTLPALLSFSSAGCFTAAEGPQALSILSRGLRKLRFWDIGYHEWIKPGMFCEWSSESVINWRKDLKDLQTLHLHYSGQNHNAGAEIACLLNDPRTEKHTRRLKYLKVYWQGNDTPITR
ncbi:hypothetical protein EC973_000369 [Apophysomyces ossiformis]|uniref:Uncharacterized protein n=1 Tax=Apophysomyces ossiformis TaxID=679940 RepID=A0A8H7BQV8_9FUNG|nr:hypothetical protein EC973_000369 [Apophysomyces ossiformis]